MSAVWMRAQAFGQPLRLMVRGSSKSGRRRSSSSMSEAPRALVSTMASLQNSMPVQAMVPRRKVEGLALRSSASRDSTSESTRPSSTSRTIIFCSTVVRTRPEPCASARSATLVRMVPSTRPTRGAKPT